MDRTLPLFSRFPKLRDALPYAPLGALPTPVEPMPGLAGRSGLYIKRDDMSGNLYGGNKVRKLEFLLADARRSGAKRIITSGAAGSNHALATALYARNMGFAVTLMLFEQPAQPSVGPNLLADFTSGAEMFHDESYPRHVEHLRETAVRYQREEGVPPYVIPPGGSCALGAVGFVNAAFELLDQIEAGLLPEPRSIFLAYGTMGTAAGLLAGLRAAGLRSSLRAVRVVPDVVANNARFRSLFDATVRLLNDGDPTFPPVYFTRRDFYVLDEFFGKGYGITTPEALAAIETFQSEQNIALDPVYTGKTGAAFLAEAAASGRQAGSLLFWDTKNSRQLPLQSSTADYRRLPVDFHRYFTVTARNSQ